MFILDPLSGFHFPDKKINITNFVIITIIFVSHSFYLHFCQILRKQQSGENKLLHFRSNEKCFLEQIKRPKK